MAIHMKKSFDSFSISILGMGAISAFLLLGFRVEHIISFKSVYHVVTSGFEEESLFAMWKYHHFIPVYNDPHQIPYSASYFNWLFYSFYGSLISLIMHHFHLNDAFIPTIGRCITLAVVSLGFLINAKLLAQNDNQSRSLPYSLAFSLSALLWLGPLVGYWAITVRPDLLALLCDVIAALFLFNYLRNKTLMSIVLAAICCYLSWACKQINIVMPIAIGLFLLTEKEWRAVLLFSVVLIVGYALTISLASAALLKTIFFVDTAVPLSWAMLIENLVDFAKKPLPAAVLWVALIGAQCSNKQIIRKIHSDKMVKFGLCGLLAWAITLLPASSKVGSSVNYYFIALFFWILAIAGALRQLSQQRSKWIDGGIALAGMVFITCIFIAFSNASIQNIQEQRVEQAQLQECMTKVMPPIFVVNHYAALPWMNPSPISFVLAYNYWSDRHANRSFEHNGIGGLIGQGYFNTLILPPLVTNTYDGASLNAYEPYQDVCGGYAVFIKKDRV